jgi:hypothetical protein
VDGAGASADDVAQLQLPAVLEVLAKQLVLSAGDQDGDR